MAYLIQTYTFTTAVHAQSNFPFAGQTDISFAGASQQTIYLDDIDAIFEQCAASSEPGQRLLKDTTLGGVTLPEGTTLTYNIGRVGILNDLTTGARYYVFFPQQAGMSTTTMFEIGDRTTVMILPVNTSTAAFDPSHRYDFGGTYRPTSIPMATTTIPPSYLSSICFAAGTLIETARGPRKVEDLAAGDLIVTRDRGLRPLGWTGRRRVTARLLDIAPNLRPVTIRRGALGPGLPAQDLTVSPQHRILVKSRIAERLAGASETLIAAKHLCDMPGIAASPAPEGIDYHHLLFDRHELVLSNGCWTESLFTGRQALKSIGPAGRREIRALFPQFFADDDSPRQTARPFMEGRDARELARRHLKNAKPLICQP